MAIRWDKFTIKAQEAIQQANELAGQHGNPEMLPLHLLAALLQDSEGIVVPVLAKLGVNGATLQAQIMERIDRLPKVSGAAAQPHLSAAMVAPVREHLLGRRRVAWLFRRQPECEREQDAKENSRKREKSLWSLRRSRVARDSTLDC